MIIWGAIAILAAFGALGMGAVAAAMFWAAVGSGLIAYGIHRNRQKQQQAQQQTVIVNNYTMQQPPVQPQPDPQPQPSGMTIRATSGVVIQKRFAVAGVTFDNDDGSSRQEILREICEGDEDGDTEAWLEWYQYRGQDAYRVMTPHGCVGNVRKNDVREAVTAIGASKVDLAVEQFEREDGTLIYRADLIV